MKRKVLFKTAETNLLKESERKRKRERERERDKESNLYVCN